TGGEPPCRSRAIPSTACRSPASSGSSCTRRSSPSHTRSPASGSRPAPSCRTICPPHSPRRTSDPEPVWSAPGAEKVTLTAILSVLSVPRPGGYPRWTVAGARPASTLAPPANRKRTVERGSHARRFHEAIAGGRRSLRPPDPALEPEDEALHLHRARRHLHHRPDPDAGAGRRGLQLREGDRRARRLRPVRRDEEAGAGRRARRGAPCGHAVCQPPLARRPAHELAHDLRPHPAAPRAARSEA